MIGLLALAAAAAPVDDDRLRAMVRHAPPAIRAYVERRTGCTHFAGEDAYDAARARELGRAMRALRCDRIDADERALRRTYRRHPDLLRLLDLTADWPG